MKNSQKHSSNLPKVTLEVGLVNFNSRTEVAAQAYFSDGFEESFAHVTDCFPSVIWKPKDQYVSNPNLKFKHSHFEFGDVLYKKNEKGEFVPYAREAGFRLVFDVHLRFNMKIDGECVERVEAFVIADEDATVRSVKFGFWEIGKPAKDILDPDFTGDTLEWVAKKSKFVKVLVDNEELQNPSSRQIPREIRNEQVLDRLLSDGTTEVLEKIIGEVMDDVDALVKEAGANLIEGDEAVFMPVKGRLS